MVKASAAKNSIQLEEDSLVVTLPEEWIAIDAAAEGFVLDMPYADTANFTHRKIYDCARCLLRPEAAMALRAAGKQARAAGFRIVIFDAYRPLPYQQKMYDVVPDKRYVADPAKGSMHNRGLAVDVGLADSSGKLLDMGGHFDDFSERAAYHYAALGKLQHSNRAMLRALMTGAGFEPYEGEWWHFNYRKKDYPLSVYLWPCP
ncbi:M15 family metallopeptidase [Taibaiella koreensis]|uniref:M15 family metallopeptidase n=1 Tax=Taibaiella koreensis TaxID=1268548 RepID=UPI001968E6A5|nr:M15 family metallopeptidase [Taibaiella koreensis]